MSDETEIFSDTAEILKQIQATSDLLDSALNQLIKPIEIQTTIDLVDSALNQFIKPIEILEEYDNIQRSIAETEEDLRVFKVEMVKMNYPPHTSLSIKQMRMIAQQCRSDRTVVEEYINEFMVRFYDSKRIQEMGVEWEERIFLQDRLPTLRNVIKAYNLGMYEVIPAVILGQSEGVLADGFGYRGQTSGIVNEIFLKNLLNRETSNFSFDDQIYKYYDTVVLVKFAHGRKIETDVSRHGFAHGGYKGPVSQEAALKSILLFDYISYRIEKIKEEQKEKANLEIKKVFERRQAKKVNNKRR
ncbi:hypothetical protein [Domibacillus epiphyticus]|uniref:Uncharacterized protein n=1 Tax=Domibacillus epiphyticus TaxID=1714355 RepID=A0A1V2A7G6_9BACI|nr:hypothetical protein [Domibacillus epiphyticus]OMP66887.1 hypothetical protein BTO28_09750 [Domibacillus epiphyticus]